MDIDNCGWLTNGISIDTETLKEHDDVSGNLSLKSCCRIQRMPDTFSVQPTGSYLTYEQWQYNRKLPEYNFQNLKNTACAKCAKEENIHGGSMRTRAPHFKNIDKNDTSLRAIQVTFSSFCNLKCKYCGPHSSTSWNEDVPYSDGMFDYGLQKQETFDHETKVIEFCKKLDLSKLVHIGIFGGEPFMARKFEEFVELIAEKTNPENINLQINTNGSIFPKPKMIELLKRFKFVDLRCSNESIGALSEYIRNGISWKTFNDVVMKWKEASIDSDIRLCVHASHNVWSINKSHHFYNWAKTNSLRIFNSSTPTPIYSNIQAVLTESQRKEVYDILEDTLEESKMKTYLQNLVSSNARVDDHEKALREFRTFTKLFDHRTPYTLKEVNPELYAWTHNY